VRRSCPKRFRPKVHLGIKKRFRPKRRKPEGAVFGGKKVHLGIKKRFRPKVHPGIKKVRFMVKTHVSSLQDNDF
jgi:hypothetical protein